MSAHFAALLWQMFESILINKSLTDLRAVEQLTDNEQLNGLAALLLEAAEHKMDGKKTLVPSSLPLWVRP